MDKNFLNTSTIHGLLYLSKKFHWIERIFWIFALVLSSIFVACLMIEMVVKIGGNPILTQLLESKIEIENINHPAITLCSGFASKIFNNSAIYPPTKYFHGKYDARSLRLTFFNETDVNMKPAIEDYLIVGDISYFELLKKFDRGEVKVEDLNMRILRRLQIVDLVTRHGTFERKNLSIPTDNFFYTANEFEKFALHWFCSVSFHWNQQLTFVSEISTEHGLCFTFNLVMPDELLDTEIVSSDFFHEYFRISFVDLNIRETVPKTCDENTYFDFIVNAREMFYDRVVNGIYDGHFVYVHDPYELPTHSLHPYPVHRHNHMKLLVEPTLVEVDESLYNMEPQKRSCYLENEKPLKFFKVYTKVNCEHECLADLMLKRCGCVEFFMIRNYTTRICSAVEKSCFDNARNYFEENHKKYCDCLLPCNYVNYDVIYKPRTTVPSKTIRFPNDSMLLSYNRLNIRKPKHGYILRKLHFNLMTSLSFVGGLLGLFAGFSSLSFVEIIYWILKYLKRLYSNKSNSSVYPEILKVSPANPECLQHKRQKNLIREYFAQSSIHGFNYLFTSNTFETTFWSFALIISISGCIALISQTNEKLPTFRIVALEENLWQESSLAHDNLFAKKEERSALFDHIPFPAVTFIPALFQNRKMKQLFYSLPYQKLLEKMRNEKFKERLLMYISIHQSKFFGLDERISRIGMDLKNIMLEIIRNSSKADYFSQQYAIFNNKYAVNFSEVHLINQLGYSFNVMNDDKIFKIDSVGENMKFKRNITMIRQKNFEAIPIESYPITMGINNKKFEFKLKVQKQPEYFDNTVILDREPRFSIHEIGGAPNFMSHNNEIDVKFGYVMIASVVPKIVITDKSLKKLSPQERQCYFEGEKQLKYFNHYTPDSCRTECFSEVIYSRCGCIANFHIFMNKPGMKYCYKLNEIRCSHTPWNLHSDYMKRCMCLPECNTVTYNVDYRSDFNVESENESVIIVKMSTEDAYLYKRYYQFTFSDVVSYVGGLLGLFAGISILSLVEIVYFFTIRLGFNLWRSIRFKRFEI